MPQPKTSQTIVVIDDDDAVRDSLAALLSSAGFQVSAYESGPSFLESEDVQRAGCLIVDLEMPGLTGLDILNRLIAEGNATPVILISGNYGTPAWERAKHANFAACLEKPFSDEQLLGAVGDALDSD